LNNYHINLLGQIKNNASLTKYKNINRYLGTPKKIYSVSSVICRNILDKFKDENNNISREEFYILLDSLNEGESFEEKAFAGGLLIRFKEYREILDFKLFG